MVKGGVFIGGLLAIAILVLMRFAVVDVSVGSSGGDAFQALIFMGNVSEIERFLKSHLRLTDAPHPDLTYPIHSAVSTRNPKVVQLLLKYGVDPNSVVPAGELQGMTALHKAIAFGDPDIVSQLIAAGADPNVVFQGVNAFERAERKGNPEILRILEEAAPSSER